MQDLTPLAEQQLAEHHTLAEILKDRIELVERIGSLCRQLDALTHRALLIKPDLQISDAALPAPVAPPPPRPARAPAKRQEGKKKTAKPKRKPATAEERRKATGQTRRERRAPGGGPTLKEQLLTWLATREEPVTPVAIADALGVRATSVHRVIRACNGQLTCVRASVGNEPSLYMRTDLLPPGGWPHTSGNDGGVKDPPVVDDPPEEEKRESAAEISARVRKEVEREQAEREAAGDVDDDTDVQPSLYDRVLVVLQEHGGLRVRAIADTLNEDPAVVARIVSQHVKDCNVRKNPDGTYYAATLQTAI